MIIKEFNPTGIMKLCTKCQKQVDTSFFNSHPHKRDGLDSWCRPCKAEAARDYYRKNITTQREKAKMRGRETAHLRVASRHSEPQKFLCRWAKCRAKRDGLPFNLKPDDVLVPDFCPVLGIPLKLSNGVGAATDNSPTVDKLIPHLGYVKGNVRVISKRANRIKGDASLEELRKITSWLEKELQ